MASRNSPAWRMDGSKWFGTGDNPHDEAEAALRIAPLGIVLAKLQLALVRIEVRVRHIAIGRERQPPLCVAAIPHPSRGRSRGITLLKPHVRVITTVTTKQQAARLSCDKIMAARLCWMQKCQWANQSCLAAVDSISPYKIEKLNLKIILIFNVKAQPSRRGGSRPTDSAPRQRPGQTPAGARPD